jgi:hypothetical protein
MELHWSSLKRLIPTRDTPPWLQRVDAWSASQVAWVPEWVGDVIGLSIAAGGWLWFTWRAITETLPAEWGTTWPAVILVGGWGLIAFLVLAWIMVSVLLWFERAGVTAGQVIIIFLLLCILWRLT